MCLAWVQISKSDNFTSSCRPFGIQTAKAKAKARARVRARHNERIWEKRKWINLGQSCHGVHARSEQIGYFFSARKESHIRFPLGVHLLPTNALSAPGNPSHCIPGPYLPGYIGRCRHPSMLCAALLYNTYKKQQICISSVERLPSLLQFSWLAWLRDATVRETDKYSEASQAFSFECARIMLRSKSFSETDS